MFKRFKNLEGAYQQKVGKREHLISELDDIKGEIAKSRVRLESAAEARTFLQQVAKETQELLAVHIEGIVSDALSAVFSAPYTCMISFLIKRGRTECEISFERCGETYDPFDDCGGGVLDVASFSLRLAFLLLSTKRRVLIIDEPFKHVSIDIQQKMGELLSELSKRLGVQIIMVSHKPEVNIAADKIIEIHEGRVVV